VTYTALPRAIINAGFDGLRLPFDVIDRLTGHDGNGDQWGPAAAFDQFEAGAKQFLGYLIGDDRLAEDGRRRQARMERLDQADRLEAEAQAVREDADRRYEERRQRAAEARADVTRSAQRRTTRVRDDAAKSAQAVRATSRKRQQAVEAAGEHRDEAIAARERQETKSRLQVEEAALAERQAALEAEHQAGALEDSLEASKARRKRS
jgi:hypothetical protein